MAKGGWEIGDICYYQVSTPMREYIGVVIDVNEEGVPRVQLHHCESSMWAASPIYVKETLPIWIGRVPAGVEWDVCH